MKKLLPLIVITVITFLSSYPTQAQEISEEDSWEISEEDFLELSDTSGGLKKELKKASNKLQTVYGFSSFANDPISYFTSQTNVFGNIDVFAILSILSLIITAVIIMQDIKAIGDDKKEKKAPFIYFVKYTFLGLLIFSPQIFTAFIYMVRMPVVDTVNYILSPISTAEAEEALARKLDIIKTYDYFQSQYDGGWMNLAPSSEDPIDNYTSFATRAGVWLYYSIIDLCIDINDIIDFVLLFISDIMIYILALLYPLIYAMNTIEGFQGGALSALKYIIAFSLWGLVGKIITSITETIGFSHVIAKIKGIIDSPINEMVQHEKLEVMETIVDNMAYENLLVIIGLIAIKAITPKIADILISGSQSGGFFTALTAMTSYAIMGGIKAMRQTTQLAGSGIRGLLGDKPGQGDSVGQKLAGYSGYAINQGIKAISRFRKTKGKL